MLVWLHDAQLLQTALHCTEMLVQYHLIMQQGWAMTGKMP